MRKILLAAAAVLALCVAAQARGPRRIESTAPGYFWVIEGKAVYMTHDDKTLELLRGDGACAFENEFEFLEKPIEGALTPIIHCQKGGKPLYLVGFIKARQVTIKTYSATAGCKDFSVCEATETASKPAP